MFHIVDVKQLEQQSEEIKKYRVFLEAIRFLVSCIGNVSSPTLCL